MLYPNWISMFHVMFVSRTSTSLHCMCHDAILLEAVVTLSVLRVSPVELFESHNGVIHGWLPFKNNSVASEVTPFQVSGSLHLSELQVGDYDRTIIGQTRLVGMPITLRLRYLNP